MIVKELKEFLNSVEIDDTKEVLVINASDDEAFTTSGVYWNDDRHGQFLGVQLGSTEALL